MMHKNLREKIAYRHLLRQLHENLAQLEAVRDSDYFDYVSPETAYKLNQILKEH